MCRDLDDENGGTKSHQDFWRKSLARSSKASGLEAGSPKKGGSLWQRASVGVE